MKNPKPKAPTPDDVAIGARVRALRLARNMSQEKLAAACGITFQQIQKYEKGTNRLSGSRMMQIAQILDVEVTDLFPAAGAAVGAGVTMSEHMVQTPQEAALLGAFRAMPQNQRDPLVALAVAAMAKEMRL